MKRSTANSSSQGTRSVIYLAYWGLMEPLGQSLIRPAIQRMAAEGVRLALITFEKTSDLRDGDRLERTKTELEQAGISWTPLRYHKGQNVLTKLRDIVRGVVAVIRTSLRQPVSVIHARTLLGGLMGFVAAKIVRKPWIFHAEGYYADEQVDAHVWQAGSRIYRWTRKIEWHLFASADAVICLSHRAQSEIQSVARGEVRVVPSCVDLRHFPMPSERVASEPIQLVYLGSVGGRYMLDRMARFAAVASSVFSVHFRVISHSDPDIVRERLDEGGLDSRLWSIERLAHGDVPRELSKCDVGLAFVERGIAVHACSLTKIGEYWAAGLPVVATPDISDTDAIIRNDRVGLIVKDHSDAAYRQAVAELVLLLREPDLRAKCRLAAEKHYALEPACVEQAELYARLQRP